MTTLLTPAYRLTVGHRVVDTTVEPKASATTDLIVTLDLDAWLDTAVLYLGQVGGLSPALDDEATVELGYADDGGFTQVFDRGQPRPRARAAVPRPDVRGPDGWGDRDGPGWPGEYRPRDHR